jgi:transcriptional regulator with XRE-family HTH domain
MKNYPPMTKLKIKRITAGLTQKELADKLGITSNAVSFYETGERFPRKKILDKIVEILECDIRDII